VYVEKNSGRVKGGAHVKFVCVCVCKMLIVNPVRPLFISITQDGKMKGLYKKKAPTCVYKNVHFSQRLVDLDFLVKSFVWYGRELPG
jgi:hypothetical protein